MKSRDFSVADDAKRKILKLYRDDISKFTAKDEEVFTIFDEIPVVLSNKEKMFRGKFSKRIDTSYLLYTKDIMEKNDIIHLPLYMSMLL